MKYRDAEPRDVRGQAPVDILRGGIIPGWMMEGEEE